MVEPYKAKSGEQAPSYVPNWHTVAKWTLWRVILQFMQQLKMSGDNEFMNTNLELL